MSRKFYNVDPDKVTNVKKHYKSHERSCLFCGSDTKDMSDSNYPNRVKCTSCDARLTLINNENVEFYITPDQEQQLKDDLGNPV